MHGDLTSTAFLLFFGNVFLFLYLVTNGCFELVASIVCFAVLFLRHNETFMDWLDPPKK